MLSKYKNDILFIVIFFILSFFSKSLIIKDYNFPFWFDLGRDAILSREIIEEKDIKIQGPSASGTNDTVFHGVAYYYLIAPAYTFSNGDPQIAMYVVIFFSSLNVIPVYLLSKKFLKQQKYILTANLLWLFSYEAFKSMTWLSNPVLASVSLPFFFYFYWQVFFDNKKNYLPYLLLALGITQQAGILFAPWWLLIFIGLMLDWHHKKLGMWNKKIISQSLVVYLISVSTMILAQLKIVKAGILNLEQLANFADKGGGTEVGVFLFTMRLYLEKITASFLPQYAVLSLLILIIIIYFLFNKSKLDRLETIQLNKTKIYFLIFFLSPLALLGWHFRENYHSFMMLEFFAILIFVMFAEKISKEKIGQVIGYLLIGLFIFTNIKAFKNDLKNLKAEYFVPQGAYLKQMLDGIDYTYQKAAGQEFTVSTMTNPYGYNTTWAYLYGWYGRKKYNYVPKFYGPDQKGIFGDKMMENAEKPAKIHFSIREPKEGMPLYLYEMFDRDQENIATSEIKKFGTLDLREHIK